MHLGYDNEDEYGNKDGDLAMRTGTWQWGRRYCNEEGGMAMRTGILQ